MQKMHHKNIVTFVEKLLSVIPDKLLCLQKSFLYYFILLYHHLYITIYINLFIISIFYYIFVLNIKIKLINLYFFSLIL